MRALAPGPLVKAILLVGAFTMTGNVQVNYGGGVKLELPLEMPPSYRQGWGRLDLANSLPLAGSALGWSLQVRISGLGFRQLAASGGFCPRLEPTGTHL